MLGTPNKRMQTRVFRAGNSQAIRIPKALELPEGEVTIEQREGGLFISTRRGQWQRFLDELEGIDPVEELKDVRATTPAREVDSSWIDG